MKKNLMTFAVILFIVPVLAFVSTNVYDIDHEDASSVVLAAKDMMINVDFESLLDVTEGSEYDKTLKTINSLEEDPDTIEDIQEQMDQILDFEIISSSYFTNDTAYYSIVKTRWYVLYTPTESTDTVTVMPNEDKTYSTIYVDYLLEKYDNKWKIISQKSR